MVEFREIIPTVTGPGAFLVSLIFLALILTSGKSRSLALDWQFAVALVAISIPLSIFITQTYHAFFTKFGFQMKDYAKGTPKKEMHKIDVMLDYLSHKKRKGTMEWMTVNKRAIAYHLFSTLRILSILFLFIYVLLIILELTCVNSAIFGDDIGIW